jgi:hypothetical protein
LDDWDGVLLGAELVFAAVLWAAVRVVACGVVDAVWAESPVKAKKVNNTAKTTTPLILRISVRDNFRISLPLLYDEAGELWLRGRRKGSG